MYRESVTGLRRMHIVGSAGVLAGWLGAVSATAGRRDAARPAAGTAAFRNTNGFLKIETAPASKRIVRMPL